MPSRVHGPNALIVESVSEEQSVDVLSSDVPIRMRLPHAERALQISLPEFSEQTIATLVAGRVEESEFIDFKAKLDLDSHGRSELAKDVCAFANARGGLIVYGIAEDGTGRATDLSPFQPPSKDVRQQIAAILRSHCRPVPSFDMAVISAERSSELIYVVIVVPRSNDAPHARVQDPKGEPWLQFPLRHEAGTTYLSESDLAVRYETRSRSIVARQDRMDSLLAHAGAALAPQPQMMHCAMAFVPVNPGDLRITERLLSFWESQLRRPNDGDRSFGCQPSLRPDRASIIQRGMRLANFSGVVELYSDGSVTSSHMVEALPGVVGLERLTGEPVPVDPSFFLIRLAGLTHLACGFAAEAGATGDVLLTITMKAYTARGNYAPMTFARETESGNSSLLVATEPVVMDVRAETMSTIDLHAGPLTSEVIADWHRIAEEVWQAFGVADVGLITADGAVAPPRWPAVRREQVSEWCRRAGLRIQAS